MIKPLYEYPTEPMSQENSRLLLGMIVAGHKDAAMPNELKLGSTYRIIEGRNPRKAHELAIGFVSMLCNSPGKCVQWAHTLHQIGEGATLTDLINKFPMGFPSDASYLQAWDDQKDSGINKLDNLELWS